MAHAAIDHMFSLIIFMAAIVLFIGIFNQSMSTAVKYEGHQASSIKTSDLLDTILLNPGYPLNWGQMDNDVQVFGLYNFGSPQYVLSPFSIMRLISTEQPLVSYFGTYSNLTSGFGSSILIPTEKTINYSKASRMLGINGTYGFQLTLMPTVTISIERTSTGTPLQFLIDATGTGFPLANANVSYSLLLINQDGEYPSLIMMSGKTNADAKGSVRLSFSNVNSKSQSYALIVHAHLYGIKGTGYYVHVSEGFSESVVPLVDSFANGTLTIANSALFDETPSVALKYNASYAILAEGYTLKQVLLDDPDTIGQLDSNTASLTVPLEEGVLIITYKGVTPDHHGLVLVPWGLSALAYSITFGVDPENYDWVSTDIRQVTIGDISYQAKLALWRLSGVAG